jgi:UTP--glucose-1-phosphate uridylyltransferase
MKNKVTKAIIPAAGLGTRFLPQTKAMPKEMLPLIDKPIIQYVVEEAVAAGITDIILVTGPHKRPIEDHFDRHSALEDHLIEDGKAEMAHELRKIADMANFIYVRQKGPMGTGTPILNAAHLIGDEPFMVLFADDLFVSKVPRAVQLVEEYDKVQAPVISLTPIAKEDSNKYGVPDIRSQIRDDFFELARLIEKPQPSDAPSNFASVGGFILTPEILSILQAQEHKSDREFYLADAIDTLAKQAKVYGKVIEGTWHDTGDKLKYLKAIIDVALEHPEIGETFKTYLEDRIGK